MAASVRELRATTPPHVVDIQRLDLLLSNARENDRNNILVSRVNERLQTLVKGIATRNLVNAEDVVWLKKIVIWLQEWDESIEKTYWNRVDGLCRLFLTPLRGYGFYRSTVKINSELLASELVHQERRLQLEKKLILPGGATVLVCAALSEGETRMLMAITKLKVAATICTAIPTSAKGSYYVITAKKGDPSINTTVIKLHDGGFVLERQKRVVATFLECLETLFPSAQYLTLRQAKILEVEETFYAKMCPRDFQEAKDWLLLVEQEESVPALIVHNAKNRGGRESLIQLALKGSNAIKEFQILDDGVLVGEGEQFSSIQDFENKYPVTASQRAVEAALLKASAL